MALGHIGEHHASEMSDLISEKIQCRVSVVSAFDVSAGRAACVGQKVPSMWLGINKIILHEVGCHDSIQVENKAIN
jgi:hypothetical protein